MLFCADLTGNSDIAADRVDHIFVSPDLNCSDFEYLFRDASDHPAVAAEIGELDEAERCRTFLLQLDPSGIPAD